MSISEFFDYIVHLINQFQLKKMFGDLRDAELVLGMKEFDDDPEQWNDKGIWAVFIPLANIEALNEELNRRWFKRPFHLGRSEEFMALIRIVRNRNDTVYQIVLDVRGPKLYRTWPSFDEKNRLVKEWAYVP